jgi:hypothetical protein
LPSNGASSISTRIWSRLGCTGSASIVGAARGQSLYAKYAEPWGPGGSEWGKDLGMR